MACRPDDGIEIPEHLEPITKAVIWNLAIGDGDFLRPEVREAVLEQGRPDEALDLIPRLRLLGIVHGQLSEHDATTFCGLWIDGKDWADEHFGERIADLGDQITCRACLDGMRPKPPCKHENVRPRSARTAARR